MVTSRVVRTALLRQVGGEAFPGFRAGGVERGGMADRTDEHKREYYGEFCAQLRSAVISETARYDSTLSLGERGRRLPVAYDARLLAGRDLRFADCAPSCCVDDFKGGMYHALGCANTGRALPLAIVNERDGRYLLSDERTWVDRAVFDAYIGATTLAAVQSMIDRLPREDRANLRPWILARFDENGDEQKRVHGR